MATDASLSADIIARAESFAGVAAGIVRLADVLKSPSYQLEPEGAQRTTDLDEAAVRQWPAEARSVLVLALRHPAGEPRLDWWQRGNTAGNRRLMDICGQLTDWLAAQDGRKSLQMPYYVEKGGLFLKDAAVLAGLGIIGRSNLLLHPQWGPRIRFRAMLIEGDLKAAAPLEGFAPCESCDGFCQQACPVSAFPQEQYRRSICRRQIKADADNRKPGAERDAGGNPIPVTQYCRACELECPVGA
jgi:epoxyqueuosine reductase